MVSTVLRLSGTCGREWFCVLPRSSWRLGHWGREPRVSRTRESIHPNSGPIDGFRRFHGVPDLERVSTRMAAGAGYPSFAYRTGPPLSSSLSPSRRNRSDGKEELGQRPGGGSQTGPREPVRVHLCRAGLRADSVVCRSPHGPLDSPGELLFEGDCSFCGTLST